MTTITKSNGNVFEYLGISPGKACLGEAEVSKTLDLAKKYFRT